MLPGQDPRSLGDQRAHHRAEAGQHDVTRIQPHQGRELCGRRVDAADDLRGAVGQEPARLGQADPATDLLEQLGAGLGLEPGQVVAQGRLGVAQLLGGQRDGSVSSDGVDDAQLDESEHS